MTSRRWSILWLGLAFGAVTLIAAYTIGSAARFERLGALARTVGEVRETRSIPLRAKALDVFTLSGDIVITGTKRTDVGVTVIRRAYAINEPDAIAAAQRLSVTFDSRAEGLSLRYPAPLSESPDFRWRWTSRYRTPDVSFLVEVPASTTVTAHSGSGDIAVHGTGAGVTADAALGNLRLDNVGEIVVAKSGHGEVRIQSSQITQLKATTTNGDIGLQSVAVEGNLEAASSFGDLSADSASAREHHYRSQNGTISLADVRGELFAKTSFGDILVRGAETAGLGLESQNGQITFQGTLAPTSMNEVTTLFGDIDLTFPVSQTLEVSLATQFGDIDSDLPILVTATTSRDQVAPRGPAGHELAGTIGSGGPRLRARTQNGDIRLRSR